MPVWKGVFHLTRVDNAGSAFGIWKNFPWVPVAVTCGTVLAILIYLLRVPQTKNFVAWTLVLGGALGNLYDRAVYGSVIHFLDFRIWPVFNFADSCICVGVGLLFLNSFREHAPHSV